MSGFHEVGRNLEIKQKIESAVVKTIESVPEKVLKPEHIETRNQKWEGQTYPGTDVSYRKSVFVQLNTVANLERTHVSNHQSGNDIANHRT